MRNISLKDENAWAPDAAPHAEADRRIDFRENKAIETWSKTEAEIIATYDKNKFNFEDIINTVKKNVEIVDISTDEGDLEDIFIKLTNN